jgi:predicted GNAT family N-acyltransferase
MDDIEYCVTTWGVDRALLQQVRRRVFVLEQQVPESEEWDENDPLSVHVLATRNREPVGTGRLTPAGKIGRMAVLSEVRGKGVGSRILRMLVEEAYHKGLLELRLNAQVRAIPFYEKHGFCVEGPEFMEAGIPHRSMRRMLSRA